MRVVIIEDDARLARVLKQGLEEEGHPTTVYEDGASGFLAAEHSVFDVIVLDVMLPGMDGFTIARRLRSAGSTVPILILTGRDSDADVIRGLEAGADDYLTKPFSFDVLLARLKALVRRGTLRSPSILRVGDLQLDSVAHEVRRQCVEVMLTRTEFSILESLMRRAGRVVTRQSLIEEVWGLDREIESNTLDAFIRLLRAKVDADFDRKLIHTIRGVGYCAREER